MITEHLSEQEIQQYALDNDSCENQIKQHVGECQHCKIKIQTYKLMFTAIKAQPHAAFDFNLADNVMQKLPRPKHSFDSLFVSFTLWLALLSLALIVFLFRNHLQSLFSAIAPLAVYLMVIIAINIFAFLCMDSYSNYLKQIKKLNYP